MFGFLNPLTRTERYRRAYARCAEHHRRRYGLRSLPFLSYESVFVYVCWLDATGGGMADDDEIGSFCSASTLVLAQTKLDDEIRDGASTLARAVYARLAEDFRDARRYFRQLDPAFAERVREIIDRHLAIERARGPISIESYAEPTAEAFGYTVSLVTKLHGVTSEAGIFRAIAMSIARALIACDCVIDLERDRTSGNFNPLRDADDIAAACSYAAESLLTARELAERAFGTNSLAVETLASVQERVTRRLTRPQVAGFGKFLRLAGAPMTSHIDASAWSELRDKLAVFLAVILGDLLDRLRTEPTSDPSVDS